MKVDVAKAIRDILTEQGSVRIPGFGNFNLIDKSAEFLSGKSKMSPPSKDVAFSEEQGDSQALTNKLKKDYKLKKSEANAAIDLFTDKIFKTLLKYDKVRITGLGMLRKRKNDEIEFEANKSYIQQFYFGLPDVSTQIKTNKAKTTSKAKVAKTKDPKKKKVVKKKVKKVAPSEAKTDKKVETNSSTDKSLEQADSTSAAKERLAKEMAALKKSEERSTTQTPITPEIKSEVSKTLSETEIEKKVEVPKITEQVKNVVEEKPKAYVAPVAAVDNTKTEIKKIVEPIQEKPSTTTQKSSVVSSTPSKVSYQDDDEDGLWPLIWPILLILGLIGASIFGIRKCSGNSASAPLVLTEDNEVLDSVLSHFKPEEKQANLDENGNLIEEDMASANETEGNNPSPVDNASQAAANNNFEDKNITVDPSECIIITGVYTKQKYADKMVSKLKTAGYIPYAERQGDLLRVGFKFECSDTDLPKFMRDVRRLIAKDAWYLQPSLKVQ